MIIPDDAIGAIVGALAPPIAKELARLLKAAPQEYDSRTALPPGVSARQFRARSKRIPEARREGRVWRCPVEAWHRSFPARPVASEDAYEAATRQGGR